MPVKFLLVADCLKLSHQAKIANRTDEVDRQRSSKALRQAEEIETEGDDDLLETVNQELSERFGISHATIQFERRMPADGCPSEKPHG